MRLNNLNVKINLTQETQLTLQPEIKLITTKVNNVENIILNCLWEINTIIA